MDILIVEVAAPHSTEPKPQEARDPEDHGGCEHTFNASLKCRSGVPFDFDLHGMKRTIWKYHLPRVRYLVCF